MSRVSLYQQDPRTATRNAAEKRFRAYGLTAIIIALLALVWLLISIFSNGLPAFKQTFLTYPVTLDAAILDKTGARDPEVLAKATTMTYEKILLQSLDAEIKARGIDVGELNPKKLGNLISGEAPATLRSRVLADPSLIGQTVVVNVLAGGRIDGYFKGRVTMESAALDKNTSPEQLALADNLKAAGILEMRLNPGFLTMPDASDKRPEAAGLGIAIIGSLYMMAVVLLLALPIGVAASGLPGRIRAEEQIHRSDRGEYRQFGGCALDCLRHLGARDLYQHRRAADLGADCRRFGADAYDPAAHHHSNAGRAESRAAVDPRCGAWRRCKPVADRHPSRFAAGNAGDLDRHHHRPCASLGRNRAAFADRHGRLCARLSRSPTCGPV